MPAIRRLSDAPYRWDIIEVPLAEVDKQEKPVPRDFIGADGFAALFGAARRRRGLSALQERSTRLREAAECGDAEKAHRGIRSLNTSMTLSGS
jgi:hypothetical protein